jgi:hypothetical protein
MPATVNVVGGPLPRIAKVFTQAAHGFIVGDVVRVSNTNTFQKARATSPSAARFSGVVSQVIDANNFELTMSGYLSSGVPAYPGGTLLYVDSLVGGTLTDVEPQHYAVPVMIILESGVSAFVVPSIDAKRTKQWLTGDIASTIGSSLTRYAFVMGSSGSVQVTEGLRSNAALPGNYCHLRVNTFGVQSALGSLTITLRNNTVDTAVSVVIPAGSAGGNFQDIVNDADIVDGIPISYKLVNAAGAASTTVLGMQILYQEQ